MLCNIVILHQADSRFPICDGSKSCNEFNDKDMSVMDDWSYPLITEMSQKETAEWNSAKDASEDTWSKQAVTQNATERRGR